MVERVTAEEQKPMTMRTALDGIASLIMMEG